MNNSSVSPHMLRRYYINPIFTKEKSIITYCACNRKTIEVLLILFSVLNFLYLHISDMKILLFEDNDS